MHIWLLDGSKSFLETGVLSYENKKLLEEAKIQTPHVEHVHISHVTCWQQNLRVKDVPLNCYPNLVLPRNTDLNTDIRPLPILEVLENHGSVCMNSLEGVERASNKIVMAKWLNKANVSYPRQMDFVTDINPKNIGVHLKWPLFLKQAQGAEGSGVAFCRTIREFNAAKEIFLAQNPGNPLLAQEAVNSSLGKDVRAVVLDGRVVATMLRRANRRYEVRANISLGGRSEPFDLPEHGKRLAIEATKALNLDYSGVDLLFLPNGQFTVCEVGSNPDWSAMPDAESIARPLIAHGLQLVQHGRRLAIRLSLTPHSSPRRPYQTALTSRLLSGRTSCIKCPEFRTNSRFCYGRFR